MLKRKWQLIGLAAVLVLVLPVGCAFLSGLNQKLSPPEVIQDCTWGCKTLYLIRSNESLSMNGVEISQSKWVDETHKDKDYIGLKIKGKTDHYVGAQRDYANSRLVYEPITPENIMVLWKLVNGNLYARADTY